MLSHVFFSFDPHPTLKQQKPRSPKEENAQMLSILNQEENQDISSFLPYDKLVPFCHQTRNGLVRLFWEVAAMGCNLKQLSPLWGRQLGDSSSHLFLHHKWAFHGKPVISGIQAMPRNSAVKMSYVLQCNI
uniref:Uncharacterized protein n=1 Tax=Micrurus lemniscatus lemniscatus TaxID=129467 RepID=A0A2D4HP77_MICLE